MTINEDLLIAIALKIKNAKTAPWLASDGQYSGNAIFEEYKYSLTGGLYGLN